MQTNLPPVVDNIDSANATKVYFEEYGVQPLEFLANEVEAAIGFFQKQGFDDDAARVTSAVLLKQAKLENTPIFKVLDQLKGMNSTDLTALVAEILNNNRPSSSALGFKMANSDDRFKTRNIAA